MDTIKQIVSFPTKFFIEQICGYCFSLILSKMYEKFNKPLKFLGYTICISLGVLICLPFLSYSITIDLLNMRK